MAHTYDAIIHDGNGILCMIVIPDDDKQLGDPSFNPPGWVQLRVPHAVGVDPVLTALALYPTLNLRLSPAVDSIGTGSVLPPTPNVT